MADGVLFLRRQFSAAALLAGRLQHGIVTEAAGAPWFAQEDALQLPVLHHFTAGAVAVRGHRQGSGAHKRGTAVFVRHVGQLVQQEFQVGGIVAVPPGPAGGKDARGATHDVNGKAGVVGNGHQSGGAGHCPRLKQGVFGERHAGFDDVRGTCRGGVHHLRVDVEPGNLPAEEFTEFAKLAFVVRGQHQPGGRAAHRVSARVSRWMAASWAVPSRARSSSWFSSSRSKGAPSAVPCTSTNLPEPVTTTFMSVSARTSST